MHLVLYILSFFFFFNMCSLLLIFFSVVEFIERLAFGQAIEWITSLHSSILRSSSLVSTVHFLRPLPLLTHTHAHNSFTAIMKYIVWYSSVFLYLGMSLKELLAGLKNLRNFLKQFQVQQLERLVFVAKAVSLKTNMYFGYFVRNWSSKFQL